MLLRLLRTVTARVVCFHLMSAMVSCDYIVKKVWIGGLFVAYLLMD